MKAFAFADVIGLAHI